MHPDRPAADERAAPAGTPAGTVVLVEGESDRLALAALASRRGRDLAAESVAVLAMGGATNIRRHVAALGPAGRGVRLAGLCDVREAGYVHRALRDGGVGDGPLERHGFFVCDVDLEDELIRGLGVAATEAVVDAMGESARLATFRRQPFQRGRPPAAQLRRFLGVASGRKAAYAPALVAALDDDRVPQPLSRLLGHL